MKRLLRLLCLLACCSLPGSAGAQVLAPAINLSTNLFTKDNFWSMSLRGARASFPSNNEIAVVDMKLTAYSGDAAKKIETVILAPSAIFLRRQNLAHGEAGVHVIRDDIDASGIHWTYDHAQKKVSLTGKVRIVFNAEFKAILK